MGLSSDAVNDMLESMKLATPDQLLLINKHSADLFKLNSRIEGRKKMQELQIGTRVMMSGTLKPQYLQRQLGTVEEMRDTRIVVKLDRGPMGKFRTGRVVCNPSTIVILANQPTD